MMQHPERITKIHGIGVEGDLIHRCNMKLTIRKARKISTCNPDSGFARIDAMETTNPRSNQSSPAATAASEIESNSTGRQKLPRENTKIPIKQLLAFTLSQPFLVKPCPFVSETFDGLHIKVAPMLSYSHGVLLMRATLQLK